MDFLRFILIVGGVAFVTYSVLIWAVVTYVGIK